MARRRHYVDEMSGPMDRSFKLLAEDEEFSLIRVIARYPVDSEAEIEHLDRELNLPALRVDHLYRVREKGEETALHFESFAMYDSDWRRRHCRYAALIWAKHEICGRSCCFSQTVACQRSWRR